MLLDDIALKYGTDKSSIYHGYTAIYGEYLKEKRNNIYKILEIGYGYGCSAKMWLDYFPNSEIHFIEINKVLSDNDRLFIHVGDQSDPIFLNQVIKSTGGNFDLIIDDGSHLGMHQYISFINLFPSLRNNGMYIVEDLVFSYQWEGGKGFIDYIKNNIIDDININGFGDIVSDRDKVITKELVLDKKLNYIQQYLYSMHIYRGLAIFIKKTPEIYKNKKNNIDIICQEKKRK